MNANARDEAIEQQASPRSTCPPPSESGILENTYTLWRELHGLAYDHLQLAALETQRAGKSLVTMIVSGIVVGILLSSAWLGLMTVMVLKLIEKEVAATDAILIAVVLNLLIALILCSVIRRKTYYLKFPATLRSLQTDAAQQAAGEDVKS